MAIATASVIFPSVSETPEIIDAEFVEVTPRRSQPIEYELPVSKAWNDPSPMTFDEWLSGHWLAKLVWIVIFFGGLALVIAGARWLAYEVLFPQ